MPGRSSPTKRPFHRVTRHKPGNSSECRTLPVAAFPGQDAGSLKILMVPKDGSHSVIAHSGIVGDGPPPVRDKEKRDGRGGGASPDRETRGPT